MTIVIISVIIAMAIHERHGGFGRIAMLLLLLFLLTFSVLVANPQKLLDTVVNPIRGLLNRGKKTKEKVWQRPPALPVRRE